MLANKRNAGKKANFQGLRRAERKASQGGSGLAFAPGKKKLSVKAPTNARDVSELLRALRPRQS